MIGTLPSGLMTLGGRQRHGWERSEEGSDAKALGWTFWGATSSGATDIRMINVTRGRVYCDIL